MRLRNWGAIVCALGVALTAKCAVRADEPVMKFTSAEVYVAGVETTEPWRTTARRQPEVIAPGGMPEILVEPAAPSESYNPGEPYLFEPEATEGSGPRDECGVDDHFLDVDFWLSGGLMYNSVGPDSNYNGPLTFADRNDGQINQVYVSFGHKADNGGCGLAVGGTIDLVYGTDHRFTVARGLEDEWNSSRFYGLAMPQAYAEVALNKLHVKLGHYYTIVGYEVVTAPDNFFYSHAYTMQYGEPFTHTGVLASYDVSDRLTLLGGFDRGWDNWEDDNNDLSPMAGATWDNGCGTTAAFAMTIGKEASLLNSEVEGDRYMHSVVLTQALTDRLRYVIQHDLGHQNNGVQAGDDSEWYGVNQYLLYELNCCWTAGARFEWFRDDDGVRVTGVDGSNPISGDRFAGNFYEVTLGLNYSPSDRLIVRPEVRYDWFEGTGSARPYHDGTKDEQLTAGLDAIVRY